jgi:hypothetical protein
VREAFRYQIWWVDNDVASAQSFTLISSEPVRTIVVPASRRHSS